MTYWGAVIPGLSMNADEVPRIDGLLALQNPGVGDCADLPRGYSLKDVAAHHVTYLASLRDQLETPFTLMGVSMGGMIGSIIGATLDEQMPPGTHYRLMVTSASTPELPAVPRALLNTWKQVTPGNEAELGVILRPFFGETFRKAHPERVAKHVRFRARGQNRHSPQGFMGQLAAVAGYDGRQFIPKLPSQRATYVSGMEDEIFGPPHDQAIEALLPDAKHIALQGVGHMVHYEHPDAFQRAFA